MPRPMNAGKIIPGERQYASSRAAMRLWMALLFATFLLFQLATVFAAPSPSYFAANLDSSDSSQTNASHVSRGIVQPGQPDPNGRETITKETIPQGSESARSEQRSGENAGDEQKASPREANVAYFIQVSQATVSHLPRLLKSIHHPENVYAIHFDLKIPQETVQGVIQKIQGQIGQSKNIHVMQSELITYRGISMLLNTISAMRLLLEEDDKWDYFINISGADYPLITAETQRQLLGHELGLNYFTYAPSKTWRDMAENRVSELWFDESLSFRKTASLGELQKLPIRNPLVDTREFEITHAEAWMISSREFCDFVLRGDMARKMLVGFSYAVDSSEHYFASLAWNSDRFRDTIVTHSMRMILWSHEGKSSGQHPYNIDERKEDGEYRFKSLIDKSVLFFARKFKDADSELMNFVDERAKKKETMESAKDHLVSKIALREIRSREL
ncbi:Xylosyltransferase family GT14 [Gracilaria domingensis]|nr:Xylosyltransferase family GT14 [Gracilaria domingensis]